MPAKGGSKVDVKVTVSLGSRTVKLDDVNDARIRSALGAAAAQVASKLAEVRCPVHQRGPTDVRIHFDKNGAADLKYDSCCADLGAKVGAALG
jgi:hypothetical protein